jgi:SAM-dependent methyltransferase
LQCPQCGLLSRQDPTLERELRRYYRQEYWKNFEEEQVGRSRTNLSVHVLDWLDRVHPARGLLVDVGCGSGGLLSLGRQRGWNVVGFEIGSQAAAHARARDLTVYEQSWPPCHLPDHSARAVTLVNVLDHLDDPFLALEEAWRVLAPGGVLYVRVPNAPVHLLLKRLAATWPWKRLGLDTVPVMHLFGFGRAALRHHLGRAGFDLLAVRAAPPSTAYPYEIGMRLTSRIVPLLKSMDLLLYRALAVAGPHRWMWGLSLEAMACKPGET